MNNSDDEAHGTANTCYTNDDNPLVTLPIDILCNIFKENAEVFKHPPGDRDTLIREHDPLLDLRNSSQVCSTWRCIILASPVLWARSISLDHLLHWKPVTRDTTDEEQDYWDECGEEIDGTWIEQDPARYLWMDEVLRRTEKAPLWVKGLNIDYKSSVKATLGLLERKWDRIERLSIESIGGHSFISEFENIITRPAPVLQEFQLSVYGDEKPPCFTPIFSNNAPCILNLIALNFRIDASANWLSNLRVLRIIIRHESTIPQLVDVLPQVPLLNTLFIKSFIDPKEHQQFQRDVFQPVGAFAKHFVQSKQTKRLKLEISNTSCTIEFTTPGNHRPDFLFQFSSIIHRTFHNFEQDDVLIESLIKILLFPEICCVTEFELLQRARIGPELFDSLTLLFSNVGVLITDERSLLDFFDTDASAQPLLSHTVFPSLHTIRLNKLGVSSFSGPKKLRNVLKRLRNEDRPFNTLDITESCVPGYYPSLYSLESLT